MNVVLLGGSGQLGTEILTRWKYDTIVAPSHRELDICDAEDLARLVDARDVDVVVNCAAFHNVDLCESEPARAFAVNALAVEAASAVCDARDVTFVTISTDYVFDGSKAAPYIEEDRACPLSVYATSKLAGELLVLRRNAKAFVVRTCGVYGTAASKSKGTFIDRVLNAARGGELIRAVNDVVASPTFAGDLADVLRKLIETRKYGLYHACNVGAVTWYDYAMKALELAGVAGSIVPISAYEWKAAARRPSYSALANGRLQELGIAMPSWEAGIAHYLGAGKVNALP